MRTNIPLIFILLSNFLNGQVDGLYRTGILSICFENGRFTWTSESDVGHNFRYVEQGKYIIHKDTIVLNTDFQVDRAINIKELKTKDDSVTLVINLTSGNEPVFTELVINDTIKYTLSLKDSSGILKFPKYFIKTISFRPYSAPWQISQQIKSIDINSTIIIATINDFSGEYWRYAINNVKYLIRPKELNPLAEGNGPTLKKVHRRCK